MVRIVLQGPLRPAHCLINQRCSRTRPGQAGIGLTSVGQPQLAPHRPTVGTIKIEEVPADAQVRIDQFLLHFQIERPDAGHGEGLASDGDGSARVRRARHLVLVEHEARADMEGAILPGINVESEWFGEELHLGIVVEVFDLKVRFSIREIVSTGPHSPMAGEAPGNGSTETGRDGFYNDGCALMDGRKYYTIMNSFFRRLNDDVYNNYRSGRRRQVRH